MDLTLDDDQAALLRELIQQTLGDLSYEIADTDNPGFKRGLREREQVLQSLLEMLGGATAGD